MAGSLFSTERRAVEDGNDGYGQPMPREAAPPWGETTLREVAAAFERGLCIHRRAPSGFVVLDVRGETIAEADTFAGALEAIAKATREALGG